MKVIVVLLLLSGVFAHRHSGERETKEHIKQCRLCVADSDGKFQWCPHTPTTHNDYDGVCLRWDEPCPTTFELPIYTPQQCAGDAVELKLSCTACLADGYTWCADDTNDDMSGSCVAIDSITIIDHTRHSSTGHANDGNRNGWPHPGGGGGRPSHEGEGDAEGGRDGHRGGHRDGGDGDRRHRRPHGREDDVSVPVPPPSSVPSQPQPPRGQWPAPGQRPIGNNWHHRDRNEENDSERSDSESEAGGEGQSEGGSRRGGRPDFPPRPTQPTDPTQPPTQPTQPNQPPLPGDDSDNDGDHKDYKDGWKHHHRRHRWDGRPGADTAGSATTTGDAKPQPPTRPGWGWGGHREREEGEGQGEREGHHGGGGRRGGWPRPPMPPSQGHGTGGGWWGHHGGDDDWHHPHQDGDHGEQPPTTPTPPTPPTPPVDPITPATAAPVPVVDANTANDHPASASSTGSASVHAWESTGGSEDTPVVVVVASSTGRHGVPHRPPQPPTGPPTRPPTPPSPPSPPFIGGGSTGGGSRGMCSRRQTMIRQLVACPSQAARAHQDQDANHDGEGHGHRHVLLTLVVVLVCCAAVCVCCVRRHRRCRQRQLLLQQQAAAAAQAPGGFTVDNNNNNNNNSANTNNNNGNNNSNCNNGNNSGLLINLPAVTTINVSRPAPVSVYSVHTTSANDRDRLRQPLMQSAEVPSEDLGAQEAKQAADQQEAAAVFSLGGDGEGQLPTELGDEDQEGLPPMPSEAVLMMDDALLANSELEGEMPEDKPKGFFARLLGKAKPAGYQPVN